ncbi:MAG: hypothetical protein KDB27_33110 [Planctomycetales bacterium]|nr:hypothetical protein [Planctomycetales bacterium]
MLGQERQQFVSLSENQHPEPEGMGGLLFGAKRFHFSTSEQMYHMVPPEKFLSLRRGGPENNFLIDSYMMMGGRTFENGRPYKLVTFSQR